MVLKLTAQGQLCDNELTAKKLYFRFGERISYNSDISELSSHINLSSLTANSSLPTSRSPYKWKGAVH